MDLIWLGEEECSVGKGESGGGGNDGEVVLTLTVVVKLLC